MPMSSTLRLLACIVAFALPPAVAAAGPSVEVTGAATADQTISLTPDRPSIDTTLRLRNKGEAGDVRIVVTPLRDISGGEAKTTWTLVDGPKPSVLVNGAGVTVTLGADAVLTLGLQATLDEAAKPYTAQVTVLAPPTPDEKPLRTIAVSVTRQLKPLASDVVLTQVSIQIDKTWPFVGQDVTLHATLRNPTGGPLDLRLPVLADVVSGTTPPLSLETKDIAAALPTCPARGKLVTLPIDQVCPLLFTIPDIVGAGSYIGKLVVTGADGGQKTADLPFSVRLHWFWAVLTTMIGGLLGASVTMWRTHGRADYVALGQAAGITADLEALRGRAAAMQLAALVDPALVAVRKVRSDIYAGQEKDPVAALAGLQARVTQIGSWLELEAATRDLSGIDREDLSDLLHQLHGVLAQQPLDTAAVDKQLAALRSALDRDWTLTRLRKAGELGHVLVPLIDALAAMPKDELKAVDAHDKWEALEKTLAGADAQHLDDAEIGKFGADLKAASTAAVTVSQRFILRLLGGGRPFWFIDDAGWNAMQTTARRRLTSLSTSATLSDQLDIITAALDAVLAAMLPRLQAAVAAAADSTNESDKTTLAAIAEALRAAEPAIAGTIGEAFAVLVIQERRFADLAHAASVLAPPKTEAAEASTAPAAVLAPEFPLPRFIPATASAATVRRIVSTVDMFVFVTTLLAFGVVAVQILWIPNQSWGSIGDVIAAILAGAGAYGGLGPTIQQWAGQVTSASGIGARR